MRPTDALLTWYWPAHGGCVEAVVDQPLGHIFCLNACAVLQGAQVNDELVRAGATRPSEQHWEVGGQAASHVVGFQDGKLAGHLETLHEWRLVAVCGCKGSGMR